MRRFQISIVGALLMGLPHLSWGQGLSTAFADVVIDGVVVGKPFSVSGPTGKGLDLRNLGENPIGARIEVLVPQTSDLRGDAQPIPDTHWIRIEPEHLDIAGHAESYCRVIIAVPPRPEYKNHTYQATLWTRSAPLNNQGMGLGAGLLSRLRFKTR